jgi:Na+/H+ antiporter NhaD/arsenite permease-like protein
MTQHLDAPHRRTALVVLVLCLGYAAALAAGLPQRATRMVATSAAAEGERAAGEDRVAPPLWTMGPFAALLVAIAVLPLTPWTAAWWDSNLRKSFVAGGLGVLTLAYYLLYHRHGIVLHWPVPQLVSPGGSRLAWHAVGVVSVNALVAEFLPFIILLFSLYTITGGVRIEGNLRAHALTNTCILGVGALLANVIGTTGAAMLLIRLLLETNRERRHVRHTVIAFIFMVCNCGGCLLPLGDPPLFLGYLLGVPFLWTLQLWPMWLATNGLLLAIYFLADHFWFYPREEPGDIRRDDAQTTPLRIRGLWPNIWLLLGIVLSVSLLDPAKTFPGTDWHPWVFLREVTQLALVLVSLLCGSAELRRRNCFHFGPIVEVAVLFFGIFLAMQPPLEILSLCGPRLGLSTARHFFWAAGSLSSVLDNAPTYAVFFETARSLGGDHTVGGVQPALLASLSLGAVFMGAMTYIGNGPNFMVKAIAEKSGVAMPSFFGYLLWSSAVLLPLFALMTWLFL